VESLSNPNSGLGLGEIEGLILGLKLTEIDCDTEPLGEREGEIDEMIETEGLIEGEIDWEIEPEGDVEELKLEDALGLKLEEILELGELSSLYISISATAMLVPAPYIDVKVIRMYLYLVRLLNGNVWTFVLLAQFPEYKSV
jgi:hypothetical protein